MRRRLATSTWPPVRKGPPLCQASGYYRGGNRYERTGSSRLYFMVYFSFKIRFADFFLFLQISTSLEYDLAMIFLYQIRLTLLLPLKVSIIMIKWQYQYQLDRWDELLGWIDWKIWAFFLGRYLDCALKYQMILDRLLILNFTQNFSLCTER